MAVLPQVAPELTEWAAFFAAGAAKRAAAEAGLTRAVTAREADDLLRDAETFLAVVETTLGLAHQRCCRSTSTWPTATWHSAPAEPATSPHPTPMPPVSGDPFVHLHVASGYSLRYGASHPHGSSSAPPSTAWTPSRSPTATASTAR